MTTRHERHRGHCALEEVSDTRCVHAEQNSWPHSSRESTAALRQTEHVGGRAGTAAGNPGGRSGTGRSAQPEARTTSRTRRRAPRCASRGHGGIKGPRAPANGNSPEATTATGGDAKPEDRLVEIKQRLARWNAAAATGRAAVDRTAPILGGRRGERPDRGGGTATGVMPISRSPSTEAQPLAGGNPPEKAAGTGSEATPENRLAEIKASLALLDAAAPTKRVARDRTECSLGGSRGEEVCRSGGATTGVMSISGTPNNGAQARVDENPPEANARTGGEAKPEARLAETRARLALLDAATATKRVVRDRPALSLGGRREEGPCCSRGATTGITTTSEPCGGEAQENPARRLATSAARARREAAPSRERTSVTERRPGAAGLSRASCDAASPRPSGEGSTSIRAKRAGRRRRPRRRPPRARGEGEISERARFTACPGCEASPIRTPGPKGKSHRRSVRAGGTPRGSCAAARAGEHDERDFLRGKGRGLPERLKLGFLLQAPKFR